jgi:hypothetical protein
MLAALPPFLADATLPQWVTASGVVGLLYVFVYRQLGIKKLDVEAQQVQVNAQTAADANEADIRDHYAQEVKRYSDELARILERLRKVDQEHEECKRERDQYRNEVSQLNDKIVGVTRQFVALQMETMKVLPPEQLTPTIEKMLADLQAVARGNGT